jgi:hypothetical protein
MSRRVRLSELLGHAEVDEGRSVRMARRLRDDGRHERPRKAPAAPSERGPCHEAAADCADEARCSESSARRDWLNW